jgi:RimJ/RimL family protein N-acetyltransferase
MLFETKRLKIRRFTIEDAAAVLEFGSNEEVIKLTGDKTISSVEEAENIIKNVWLPEYDTYGYARMAVIYKKDKKLIGFAGLKFEKEWNVTDIGYRFLPKYWGKGIATEASLPFIFYGFNVLKLPKIVGVAFTENIASCKVLENLGLQLKKQGNLFDDGIDCKWYELEREEYQGLVQSKRSRK